MSKACQLNLYVSDFHLYCLLDTFLGSRFIEYWVKQFKLIMSRAKKFFKRSVLAACICLCLLELITIARKSIGKESFRTVSELHFDRLLPPSITLCPGPAWKKSGPFLSQKAFEESTYSWDEIFHPITLAALRNESLFKIQTQYASYYGLCFVIQKLNPEKVSDYSFQIVVTDTMDYNYYLHEPYENEYLLQSVYPYAVEMVYFGSSMGANIGAIDIIYRKEITAKLSGKNGCQDISIEEFAGCIRHSLQQSLENSTVKCKIPLFDYTTFNIDNLEYCNTTEDALAVETLVYELAQKNHAKYVCGSICKRPTYLSILNPLSKRVLSKELQKYGDGYLIIWAFYSSLHVEENIETYLFDFNSAVIAVGGSLGLFVGWSLYSIITTFVDYIPCGRKSSTTTVESNYIKQNSPIRVKTAK